MDNNLKWIFNNNIVNAAYFSNEQIYPTNENVTVNVIGPQEGFEVSLYDVVTHGDNDEYIELEYIESTGTQYIDTEFKPNNNTRIVMDFENLGDYSAMTTGLCPFFGARNATSSAVFALWVGTKTYPHYGNVSYNKNGYFSVDINTRLIYDFNKNVVNIGDTQITCSTSTFTTNYNLYLFTVNNYGNVETRRVSGKLYSCKIYDNNSLIRDYVPVINLNGVCGLFDKVNNKFYPSVTDNFIRGNTNSNYAAIQTQSTATHKIKRNAKYVVEAGDIEGYITPEKQLFTAKNYSRVVDIIYEESPVTDLSMFDIYGNPILQNTANCYVVNKPGFYKIPLVFGNAIYNGCVNAASYTNNMGGYSHNFQDYLGGTITSPYIEIMSGIAASAQLSIADTDGIFTDISIVNGSPCRYLQFNIANVPDTGANGVLSIMDDYGFIMWSWHIWIWPYDLTPVEIINDTAVGYNILPVNLATKLDATNSINKTTGWKNWFYQFGRPTPLLCPATYNASSNHTSYGILNYAATTIATDLSTGIQNPTTFYKSSSSYNYNWFQAYSYQTRNLWDADCTTIDNSDNIVVKTIYDPCPIGFKMPNGNTFTGFSINDYVSRSAGGYKFKCNPGDTVGVFFPYSGYRYDSSGALTSAGSKGYVWLSSHYSQTKSYNLTYDSAGVYPQSNNNRALGFSVRPVQEQSYTYSQLDSLDTANDVYINTGIKPNQNTRVVCQARFWSSSTDQFLFGCRNSDSTNAFGMLISSANNNFRAIYGNEFVNFNITPLDNAYVFDLNKNTCSVETSVQNTPKQTFQTDHYMYLFACNEAGGAGYNGNVRFYSCQIYDGDTLVRDFIPVCRMEDEKYGLYDKVHKMFYTPIVGNFER